MFKILINTTIIIVFAIYGQSSFSQDSAVVRKMNNKVEIEYGDQKVSPVETIKVNSDVSLYIVKSGEVGTTVMVTIYRGIIWSESSQKALRMYPYKYEISGEAPYEIDQPIWTITPQKISIEDSNIDLKTALDL
jgi:hypothetical protein